MTRGPIWGMLVVFLVLVVAETVQGMPPASSGVIGYRLGFGGAIPAILGVAVLGLLIGGVYYLSARKDGVTFREAIINWTLVILVGLVVFLILL